MARSRTYQLVLTAAVILLLLVAGGMQRSLNRDRVKMGIGRGEMLGKAAPPVLVFTTVALGGFRGLIANALWIRAYELQEEDKFFEKVQLADWITKLQPRFVTVWVYQAWDMAYNISVKFDSPVDRWQWVKRGIELLRDEALRYNPDETLLYQQLAWLFQHKMGQDLDDAHYYYKSVWARQMDTVLGGTNYLALINPQTDDEKERANLLTQRYKMDPEQMRAVDAEYGPLEWRLPESHAVYWAMMGMRKAKPKEIITLRRAIYQSLQTAFRRGRLIAIDDGTGEDVFQFGPNLSMIPNANRAYETMMEQDEEYRDHIGNGHKNFLRDAVAFLYVHNRPAEAQQWMDYLLKKYPDASVVDSRREGEPIERIDSMSLDEYVAARASEVAGETSNERSRDLIEGLLVTSMFKLATGEDAEARGNDLLAQNIWNRYTQKTRGQAQRIALPPIEQMRSGALRYFEQTYPPILVNRLRAKLGLPPLSTNAPVSTNAVEAPTAGE